MTPLIPRDLRFTLEEQWEKELAPLVEKGVAPLTCFAKDGMISGWKLVGYEFPPPIILYTADTYWWQLEW
jgi:hypothetical protein